MNTVDRIAFYGTLRRGQPGHLSLGLADRLRFAGACKIRGVLIDLGSYPGLSEGDGIVVGELYAIGDGSVLADLDRFEEYDPAHPEASLFLRKEVVLIEPAVPVFVYYLNDDMAADRSRTIPSGDWMDRAAASAG
jgi:gamma-glutamylcyclotransferase (GGCT)/AIG2-like uncharacterized protein YtfP